MQHFRLKLAAALVIGVLAAMPASATMIPCPSPTYQEMQQNSADALSARADHIKTLMDRANQMSVDKMACLDIFKNMTFGGMIRWMSMSALIDQVVARFWDAVCNAAASAYNQATSGLSQALQQNLQLPGQLGQVTGPVLQVGGQVNPGTMSGGSGSGGAATMNSTSYGWNGQNGGAVRNVDPFSSGARPSSGSGSGSSGSFNLFR